MSQKQIELEDRIFKRSIGFLKELFGEFSIDESQIDKPDRAIVLEGNKKIGIEITSVDQFNDLKYLNDKNMVQEVILKQLEDMKRGVVDTRPRKKLRIVCEEDYIFKGVRDKEEKYKSYKYEQDEKIYDEVIIIASSEFIDISHKQVKDDYALWTSYLLSRIKFKFDKVIFVHERNGCPILVYDKAKPSFDKPKEMDRVIEVDVMHGSLIPFNEEVNINDYFNQSPVIERHSKNKKRKRKDKNKNQKIARRNSRQKK